MNVNSYLYQSPSPQSVQVGRLDPSSKSSDTPESGDTSGNSASGLSANESFQDAQNFQSTQESEVKPTVKSDSGNTLDVYA